MNMLIVPGFTRTSTTPDQATADWREESRRPTIITEVLIRLTKCDLYIILDTLRLEVVEISILEFQISHEEPSLGIETSILACRIQQLYIIDRLSSKTIQINKFVQRKMRT